MQTTENPFEGKLVQIQLKESIEFQGRDCSEIPLYGYESDGATIEKWLPNGIIINGGCYIPHANIKAIAPYKTHEEIKAMRAASRP